jgi:hypothetical protein
MALALEKVFARLAANPVNISAPLLPCCTCGRALAVVPSTCRLQRTGTVSGG